MLIDANLFALRQPDNGGNTEYLAEIIWNAQNRGLNDEQDFPSIYLCERYGEISIYSLISLL